MCYMPVIQNQIKNTFSRNITHRINKETDPIKEALTRTLNTYTKKFVNSTKNTSNKTVIRRPVANISKEVVLRSLIKNSVKTVVL